MVFLFAVGIARQYKRWRIARRLPEVRESLRDDLLQLLKLPLFLFLVGDDPFLHDVRPTVTPDGHERRPQRHTFGHVAAFVPYRAALCPLSPVVFGILELLTAVRAFQADGREYGRPVQFLVAVADRFILEVAPVENRAGRAGRADMFKLVPLAILRVLVPLRSFGAALRHEQVFPVPSPVVPFQKESDHPFIPSPALIASRVDHALFLQVGHVGGACKKVHVSENDRVLFPVGPFWPGRDVVAG